MVSCKMDEGKPVTTGLEGKQMPGFSLLLTDSTRYFSSTQLYNGKPTVLFYFSPTCPYCRIQTRRLVEDAKKLSGLNIVFVGTKGPAELNSFVSNFRLAELTNVQVGTDTGYIIGNYFRNDKIPALALYDKDQKLSTFYLGVVKTQTLTELLN